MLKRSKRDNNEFYQKMIAPRLIAPPPMDSKQATNVFHVGTDEQGHTSVPERGKSPHPREPVQLAPIPPYEYPLVPGERPTPGTPLPVQRVRDPERVTVPELPEREARQPEREKVPVSTHLLARVHSRFYLLAAVLNTSLFQFNLERKYFRILFNYHLKNVFMNHRISKNL